MFDGTVHIATILPKRGDGRSLLQEHYCTGQGESSWLRSWIIALFFHDFWCTADGSRGCNDLVQLNVENDVVDPAHGHNFVADSLSALMFIGHTVN